MSGRPDRPVYRAELAPVPVDPATAADLLAEADRVDLTPGEERRLAAARATADLRAAS